MNITETSKNGVTVVALEGRLDIISAPKLQKNRSFMDAETPVVIDLEKVGFMDSTGLRAIVSALNQKKQGALAIVLACMNDQVRRTFALTNTLKLFHIFDDTDAAIDFAAARQSERI